MRRFVFWLGWAVLVLLPVIYGVQIFVIQDFPRIEPWKWLLLFGAVVGIYFSRDRDDVLKHHLVG